MRIHIVARKIELTESIRSFIEAKINKLEDYIKNIVWAQAILTVEKKRHTAEIVVHAGRQTMRASATATDLYSAVDSVMDKIEVQIKKYKERFKEYDVQKVRNYKEYTSYSLPEIRFSVFKNVSLKPMNREEAVLEMERLGYNFWMFMDKPSKQVLVVFKRLDNTYGLLQPVRK
ncbi:MAG: ribosome-associated translation inhibitor RaiA [Elusimicrobia bacterium]|nr:ribosome-associated translation inhibitor RaiA [Elusimicrobiota bacterium]